jgi:hypothetical protein
MKKEERPLLLNGINQTKEPSSSTWGGTDSHILSYNRSVDKTVRLKGTHFVLVLDLPSQLTKDYI